ncbi:MAG: hypothetical protein A2Y33_05015 [Spirochaetes bacterium GWF1_51_8]|nr:MAG: hypothetical protein A2Y33_05015 [Spirochaetes bacterium GWF1_51_8]
MPLNEKVSLGEYLQEARKQKGISVDEIVRETNISKKYLESLEMNDLSVFPGETYILGFLATYADTLELDRNTVISIYKRQMRIEQDAPIEQLVGITPKKKSSAPQIDFKSLGIIGGILGGLLLLILIISNIKIPESSAGTVIHSDKKYHYQLTELEKITKQEYYIGDTITISNGNSLITLELKEMGASKSLQIAVNKMNYNIKERDVLNIDSDGNNIKDMGVELTRITDSKIFLGVFILKEDMMVKTNQSAGTIQKYQAAILAENELLSSKIKTRIDMKLVAEATGFVEFSADGSEPKQFSVKKGMEIPISFENEMTLLLGNAGAVKIMIGDKAEAGGSMGEVNKSIFYWKNNQGQFSLNRAFLK